MSYASALAKAAQLKESMLDHGVPRVNIDLVIGRNGDYDGHQGKAVLGHHIASYPSQGNAPGYNVVKYGRSDLPGPLANVHGAFDGTATILTFGWANHSGEGGPWRLPNGLVIPRDNGRPYIFGNEHEGGYLDWTDVQLENHDRIHAAELDFFGLSSADYYGEHRTWADMKAVGRKFDRKDISTAAGRAGAARFMTSSGDWFDMASKEELAAVVRGELNRGTGGGQSDWAGTAKATLGTAQGLVNQVTELRAAVAAAVPGGSSGGLLGFGSDDRPERYLLVGDRLEHMPSDVFRVDLQSQSALRMVIVQPSLLDWLLATFGVTEPDEAPVE